MNFDGGVISRLSDLATNGSLVFSEETLGTVIRLSSLMPNVYASVVDGNGMYVWASESMRSFRSSDGFVGRRFDELGPPEWARERLLAIREVIRSRTPTLFTSIFLARRMFGVMIPVWMGSDEPLVFLMAVDVESVSGGAESPCELKSDLPTVQFLHVQLGDLSLLTRRQLETLRLVAMGKTNEEIAAILHRTRRLVEWHIRMLLKQTGARDRIALSNIGRTAGLHLVEEVSFDLIVSHRAGDAQTTGMLGTP
jgi:DNA-binding CsgD family transcriptional regulator